jgi:ribosomal protein L37AE/L43A
MKESERIKFSWCPVCMVHTYHRLEKGEWQCLEKDHQYYLKYRTDPWIEEYRRSRAKQQITVSSEV